MTGFRCHYCDCVAESIHILPCVGDHDMHVALACGSHDPGGDWFWIEPDEDPEDRTDCSARRRRGNDAR